MLTQPTPVSVGFFCLKSRSSANIPEIVQRSATRRIFPVARRRNRISRSLFIFLAPYWRHEKTTRLHASRNPDCDADRRGAWCIWAVWLAALAAATAAVADKTVIANVGALPLLGDSYYAVDRFTSGTDVLANRARLLIKPNGDILLAGGAEIGFHLLRCAVKLVVAADGVHDRRRIRRSAAQPRAAQAGGRGEEHFLL